MRFPKKSTCYLEKLKKNTVPNGCLYCRQTNAASAHLIFPSRQKTTDQPYQVHNCARLKPALLAKRTSFEKGKKLRAVEGILLE